jgi:hypothetical protein
MERIVRILCGERKGWVERKKIIGRRKRGERQTGRELS